MSDAESAEYVLQTAREHDVKFIRLWFTDILGSLKSMAITIEGLGEALEEGVGFDGSSIEGFARIDESDMIAMPDPSTFAILPWRPSERRVARLFCDVLTTDGKPFEGDPRNVLRRNVKRAADLGLSAYTVYPAAISDATHGPRSVSIPTITCSAGSGSPPSERHWVMPCSPPIAATSPRCLD